MMMMYFKSLNGINFYFLLLEIRQIGAIFLWSLVYNIIRISSSGSTREDAINGSSDETSKLLPRDCTRGSASTKDTSIYECLEDQHAPSFEKSKELIQNPKVYLKLCI